MTYSTPYLPPPHFFLTFLFLFRTYSYWHALTPLFLSLPHPRGGHRHLQIGRMLDNDLILEPPTPPPPNVCIQSVGICVASWGLRMSRICPCTPCPSPQGYRSKVESRHFAHHCLRDDVGIFQTKYASSYVTAAQKFILNVNTDAE